MSLSIAIAIIFLADLALLAGLSYVMSRAKLLTPHTSSAATMAQQPATASHRAPAPVRTRTRSPHARAIGQPVEA
jgi:hypothetical protein